MQTYSVCMYLLSILLRKVIQTEAARSVRHFQKHIFEKKRGRWKVRVQWCPYSGLQIVHWSDRFTHPCLLQIVNVSAWQWIQERMPWHSYLCLLAFLLPQSKYCILSMCCVNCFFKTQTDSCLWNESPRADFSRHVPSLTGNNAAWAARLWMSSVWIIRKPQEHISTVQLW